MVLLVYYVSVGSINARARDDPGPFGYQVWSIWGRLVLARPRRHRCPSCVSATLERSPSRARAASEWRSSGARMVFCHDRSTEGALGGAHPPERRPEPNPEPRARARGAAAAASFIPLLLRSRPRAHRGSPNPAAPLASAQCAHRADAGESEADPKPTRRRSEVVAGSMWAAIRAEAELSRSEPTVVGRAPISEVSKLGTRRRSRADLRQSIAGTSLGLVLRRLRRHIYARARRLGGPDGQRGLPGLCGARGPAGPPTRPLPEHRLDARPGEAASARAAARGGCTAAEGFACHTRVARRGPPPPHFARCAHRARNLSFVGLHNPQLWMAAPSSVGMTVRFACCEDMILLPAAARVRTCPSRGTRNSESNRNRATCQGWGPQLTAWRRQPCGFVSRSSLETCSRSCSV